MGTTFQKETHLHAITVRIPNETAVQVQRIARDQKQSMNETLIKIIEDSIALIKGTSKIRAYIEECSGWFGLDVDKLTNILKNKELTLYERAYLAYNLEYQTRMNLFEKLNLSDDLSQVNMIDDVLQKSKEKRDDKIIYNLYKVANNIKVNLTDLGENT